MKKIALTSLLALVAATSANAANVINNNPLYKPGEGHFASVTSLETHTNSANADSYASMKQWGLRETFGYGVSDDLTVYMSTSVARLADTVFDGEDANVTLWKDFGLGVDYRIFNIDGWVLDADAYYSVMPVGFRMTAEDETYKSFLDKEDTMYSWTYGLYTGYMGEMFTVAGHVMFDYTNSESFNWGNKDASNHAMMLGIDGQIILSDDWNITMGAEYTAQLDKHEYIDGVEYDIIKNRGVWTGYLGVNYNISETMYVGGYVNGGLYHKPVEDSDNESSWSLRSGIGMGVKFGIDF